MQQESVRERERKLILKVSVWAKKNKKKKIGWVVGGEKSLFVLPHQSDSLALQREIEFSCPRVL